MLLKERISRRASGRTPFVPYSSLLRSAYENIEEAVLFLLCLVIMCDRGRPGLDECPRRRDSKQQPNATHGDRGPPDNYHPRIPSFARSRIQRSL